MSTSVVDRIREQMDRQDGVAGEDMEPLARAYGLEVGQANDRLNVCVNLLRKGLRSEAIQQANMRPTSSNGALDWTFPKSKIGWRSCSSSKSSCHARSIVMLSANCKKPSSMNNRSKNSCGSTAAWRSVKRRSHGACASFDGSLKSTRPIQCGSKMSSLGEGSTARDPG